MGILEDLTKLTARLKERVRQVNVEHPKVDWYAGYAAGTEDAVELVKIVVSEHTAEVQAGYRIKRRLPTFTFAEYGLQNDKTGTVREWGRKNHFEGVDKSIQPEGWTVVERTVTEWKVVE